MAVNVAEPVTGGKRQTGEMRIPSKLGDTKYTWDPANRNEVAMARKQFEEAIKGGMFAYRVTPGGSDPAEQIREFDPAARAIIFRTQTVGG